MLDKIPVVLFSSLAVWQLVLALINYINFRNYEASDRKISKIYRKNIWLNLLTFLCFVVTVMVLIFKITIH